MKQIPWPVLRAMLVLPPVAVALGFFSGALIFGIVALLAL